MRLFGKVNNAIDRYERADWMTPPFDMIVIEGIVSTVVRGVINAAQINTSGSTAGQINTSGITAGQVI